MASRRHGFGDGLLEWTRETLAGAPERPLTAREVAAIPEPFRLVLPIAHIRLVARAHNPFALRKILVRRRRIFWPDTPTELDRDPRTLSLLFHELAHVWQYETGRLTAVRYLTDPANWQYRYVPGRPFDGYGAEAQADLIEDWCRVRSGLAPHRFEGAAPDPDWLDSVVPFTSPPRPLG